MWYNKTAGAPKVPRFQAPGAIPWHFRFGGCASLPALSVFCDEAGQQDMSAGYYLLTLIVHDQTDSLERHARDYRAHVARNRLPDIPFHMRELLHGHGDYEGLDQKTRKKLLVHFNIFMQKAPIRYRTFAYSPYDTIEIVRNIVSVCTRGGGAGMQAGEAWTA